MVGISILNRLVLPTSVEDVDMMLSNPTKEETLSLVSFGTCALGNITNCLLELLCSRWKLNSGCMIGSLVGLF